MVTDHFNFRKQKHIFERLSKKSFFYIDRSKFHNLQYKFEVTEILQVPRLVKNLLFIAPVNQ